MFKAIQPKDKFKERICQAYGITLLVVPFWWDRSMESVAKTLHNRRPDLRIPEARLKGKEIPMHMPQQQPEKGTYIYIYNSSDNQCIIALLLPPESSFTHKQCYKTSDTFHF